MREFDNNGLRLAEYQAKLFEESISYFECSTKVFLRRFYYSDLLNTLDKNESSISLEVSEGLDSIELQFGSSNYGKVKWDPNVLFWIGYIYRYVSYTRDVETKFLMKLFKPEKIKDLYYTYHTQSNEWVVENLLTSKNLNESIFDKNYRLKQALKKIHKLQNELSIILNTLRIAPTYTENYFAYCTKALSIDLI